MTGKQRVSAWELHHSHDRVPELGDGRVPAG